MWGSNAKLKWWSLWLDARVKNIPDFLTYYLCFTHWPLHLYMWLRLRILHIHVGILWLTQHIRLWWQYCHWPSTSQAQTAHSFRVFILWSEKILHLTEGNFICFVPPPAHFQVIWCQNKNSSSYSSSLPIAVHVPYFFQKRAKII